YNTSVTPSLPGPVSGSLTLGVNGSVANRTTIRGCLVSGQSTSITPCSSGGTVGVGQPLDDRTFGGFGSARIGLFEQLYLTLGLRGEKNPFYGDRHSVDWTPTYGVAYTLSRGDATFKFLASY